MKQFLSFLLALSTTVSPGQDTLHTVFEKTNGTETGTYREVIRFYTALAAASPVIEMKKMGDTDSGLPLHLVTLDPEQDFDFSKSREKGKTIILINNGIHPGEPDGIAASQMLLRDYTNGNKQKLLKDLVIAVIPVYNIGGTLNRNSYSRANQNGPLAYGFRGNARNYDLNRDFIKADTKNTRAFYEIFHAVQPDIFIDTHVSNGADYQYSITHLASQPDKMGGEMGEYIRNKFTPELEKMMAAKGSEITPYVNVFNTTPDASGIRQFLDLPRYSTGYAALFNTLGFMIETHMLKPFDVRVEATYDFLETVLQIGARDGKKIRQLHRSNRIKPGSIHAVSWKLDTSRFIKREFKGYEGEMIESTVTGQPRLFYNRAKPFTREIPYYNTYIPAKHVVVPNAYLIPQGWHEVIDRLKWNNVSFERLEKDSVILVERYRIESFDTTPSAYEGHYLHSNVEVSKDKQQVDFRAGDYIFYVDQAGGRYLVETLEPQATDSFFNWNFFDTILQQKEHFSPYVFEETALRLLQENPALKRDFEQRKSADREFGQNGYAQLVFIYKHSPYYERAHMQYPIYRLVE